MENITDNSILDMKTLVHVGVELVLVSGISFWLNKKISNNNEEISEIKTKLAEYEKVIAQQNQLLGRHEQVLQHIMNGGAVTLPPKPALKNQNMPISKRHEFPQKQMNQMNDKTLQTEPLLPSRQRTKKHVRFENNVPNEKLDDILGNELNNIMKSRSDPEFIEISSNLKKKGNYNSKPVVKKKRTVRKKELAN